MGERERARRSGSTGVRPIARFVRAQAGELKRLRSIRPRAPAALRWRVARWYAATVLRESAPHLALAGLAVCALLLLLGASGAAIGVVVLALAAIAVGWELRLVWIAHRSTVRIDEALEGIEVSAGPRVPRRHLVFPPLMFFTRGVRRRRGVRFATVDGTRLRLDVYRPVEEPRAEHDDRPRPGVIQVHGGGWFAGSRYEQGIPLLNHLAASGWVGFNADYRLAPAVTVAEQIVDVKRAIAWVRENAAEHDVDPKLICITGGSAGGHLTALAALTANDPALQPGFEDADTSVAAAVPFYGVYDLTDAEGVYYPELREWVLEQIVIKRRLADDPELYRNLSPRWRVRPDAPPFLVIHGDRDTLVPVADARSFVAALRDVSTSPVRYVELPGAEHAFDLWPSERTARIAEGIGRFLTAVVESRSSIGQTVRL